MTPSQLLYINKHGDMHEKEYYKLVRWWNNNIVGISLGSDIWCIYQTKKYWICADVSVRYSPDTQLKINKYMFAAREEAIMYGLDHIP